MTQESTARARPWLLVGASTVVIAWGGNQFLPLMQMYRALFDYSQFEVDVLLAFYIVGIFPGFALAGPLSDRHGRKPVMVAGLALGILGSALLAVTSSSLIGMCLGRTVSGLSVAAGMVVGSSWIKEHSQLEGRGEAGARRAAIALSLGFAGGAGVLVCCAGAVLLSLAADDGDLWPVAVAAPVFGLGYGLTMVAGLTAVQALATPQTLAGVTAVFYALTYVGFLLPAALAAVAGAVDMRILLLAVAAVGVLTAAASSASLRGLGRGQ